MKIRFGDVEIGYDRAGEGEPVLLVAGMGAPRISWFHQIQFLTPHYDVTTFDNRGCGETTCSLNWAMPDMAGDAIALADAMGYERFHLVGISMGGMISQEVVLNHPERVRSLTLIATSPGGPEAEPLTPDYMAALMIPDPQERTRRSIELLFGEKYRRENPEMIDLVVKVMTSGGSGVATIGNESANQMGFIGQVTAVAGWMGDGGSSARLGEIRTPTLVMHGTEDHLLPVGNGRILGRDIPDARLRIFEGAGHALTQECAEEVNAELANHFADASERVTGRS